MTPNVGLGSANASRAAIAGNLLDGGINSPVSNVSRTLSVPLAGNAPPAVNSTCTVGVDGSPAGIRKAAAGRATARFGLPPRR